MLRLYRAGRRADYSSETEIGVLRPYVDAAKAAGIYVVLDLQPGRTDFLTQAKRYAELLAEPHVGLALDPEWRLKPNQRHRALAGIRGTRPTTAGIQRSVSTRLISPQGTSRAAWRLRTASSSGPSSRQYTFPSAL